MSMTLIVWQHLSLINIELFLIIWRFTVEYSKCPGSFSSVGY